MKFFTKYEVPYSEALSRYSQELGISRPKMTALILVVFEMSFFSKILPSL